MSGKGYVDGDRLQSEGVSYKWLQEIRSDLKEIRGMLPGDEKVRAMTMDIAAKVETLREMLMERTRERQLLAERWTWSDICKEPKAMPIGLHPFINIPAYREDLANELKREHHPEAPDKLNPLFNSW
jgi:hypothetical protein